MVGVTSEAADVTLRAVYASVLELGTPYIVTDLATAELVKVAANAFLATKISFINAIANVCDAAGADVMTLADALGHDSRIGRRFLSAGLGFGGGCLSKDIRAFMARPASWAWAIPAVPARGGPDQHRPRALAAEVARELAGGSFAGRNVAVLGAAFKPGTDDVRDSPALSVARMIQSEGAVVRVHDPRATITHARPGRLLTTWKKRSRPARQRTWCCTSPNGPSTASSTRSSWPPWSGPHACSTGATCCP